MVDLYEAEQSNWTVSLHKAEWEYITSNVFFTGLNGKIEWCEQWTCMRLNSQIECFLHESEWSNWMVSLHKAEWGYITSNNCTFLLGWMVRLNGVNNRPVWGWTVKLNVFCTSLNGKSARGWARQLQTGSCLFVFVKMWEIHGLTFLELKQAVKRLRLQLSSY